MVVVAAGEPGVPAVWTGPGFSSPWASALREEGDVPQPTAAATTHTIITQATAAATTLVRFIVIPPWLAFTSWIHVLCCDRVAQLSAEFARRYPVRLVLAPLGAVGH